MLLLVPAAIQYYPVARLAATTLARHAARATDVVLTECLGGSGAAYLTHVDFGALRGAFHAHLRSERYKGTASVGSTPCIRILATQAC